MSERRDRGPVLRISAFSAALAAAAATLVLVVLPLVPAHVPAWHVTFPLIVAGFAITELLAIHVEVGRNAHSLSLTELPLVIGLFFCDPLEVVFARLVGGFLVIAFVKRQEPLKIAFNSALFALEGAIAATVFHSMTAGLSLSGMREGWIAAFSAAVITNVTSAACITTVIALATGERDPGAFRTIATGSIIASVATTSLALMTVTLLLSDGASAGLVAVVAMVLFIAYRGYTSLRQRYSNLHHLYDFTRMLAGSTATDPTIRATLEKACDLMRAGAGELLIADGHSILTVTYDAETKTLSDGARSGGPDTWPSLIARSERKPILLAENSRDEAVRKHLETFGHKDMLIAPLIQGDIIFGTIAVFDRLGEVSTFDHEDMKVFEAIALHASVSLENGRLIDRLRDEAAERAHQATHDSLTGLGNRRLFGERVTDALRTGERAGVLLLDLNRFKDVNDSLGHHCGDALLREVAGRLAEALPAEVTVARLGGDEFAVLVPNVGSEEQAQATGAHVLRSLERPFLVEGLTIVVGAAVGVAVSPEHGTDATTLLRHADVAMYAAKDSRSEEARIYSPSLDQGAARRLALAAELREAIETQALHVYFQPKADSATGAVLGMEALVRWQREDGTWVAPDEFIPVAEHVGLIRPLTQFVLKQAVRQAAQWRDAGTPVTVAVNLSAQSLIDARLSHDVQEATYEAGLDPRMLTLEITESEVISDPARTMRTLDAMRSIGCELSVDDFGTGYSSLSYLQRLPIQEVKIDKSFVFKMLTNEGDAAIVRSIIDLGRNLRLRVVAEGVEDQETWDVLASAGCDLIQGYFLSKPMPAEETTAWLAARPQPSKQPLAKVRSLTRTA
jgi:diguanylate cyclase (GGDEF)-like protein